MNALRCFLLIVSFGLVIAPAAGLGQQPRAFTNQAGKTLTAVPLRLIDGLVELKRVPDGQVFKIPLHNLSAADQAWLTAWAAGSALPGGWSVLRVHLPVSYYNEVNKPEVIGMASNAAWVGASSFELLLPRGAWVQVTVVDYAKTGQYLEHMIRFDGEREWTLSAEGALLMLTRDGGPPKVAGITLPDNSPEKFLAALDPARCEAEISLDMSSGDDLKLPELAKFKIAALKVGVALKAEYLAPAAALRPKAMRVHLTAETAGKLDVFTTLEAVLLRRDRECPASALGALPPARDVSVNGFAFSPALEQSLAANTRLRMLCFLGEDTRGGAGVLQWKGLAKITTLEALHVLRGVELDAAEVAALPALRSFNFNMNAFPKGSANLPDLARLSGLLELNLSLTFPPEVFAAWSKGGGLNSLVKLNSSSYHDVEKLTKLRVLEMTLPQEERRQFVARLAGLPDLRSLKLSGVGKSDMPALTNAKIKNTLENLDLVLRKHYAFSKLEFGSDYLDSKDLGQLAGYTALRRLQVSGGNISQFDLKHFPGLEALRLRDMDDLELVIDLAAAAHLKIVEIEGCKKLRNLGVKAPNAKLCSLELANCELLTDISALHQTSGLQFIQINRCALIPEPLTLDKINPVYSLSVRSCALLQDRYVQLKARVP
jgi:hypothetical protein